VDAKQLVAIERWNLLLGGLAVLIAAAFLSEPVALGVAVGAVLGAINFTSIRRIWQGILRADGGRKQTLQILMMLKMILLMVAVALAIAFLPLSPPALAVGLSIFMISIAIESVRFALRTPSENGNG
jgi:hypothetical protein